MVITHKYLIGSQTVYITFCSIPHKKLSGGDVG